MFGKEDFAASLVAFDGDLEFQELRKEFQPYAKPIDLAAIGLTKKAEVKRRKVK